MRFGALLVAFVAQAAEGPALAQETDVAVTATQLKEAECDAIEMTANVSMLWRQNGKPLSEARKELLSMAPDLMKDISESILLDAYDQPRYGTAQFKQDAVTDFASEWYLSCLKTRKPG
jgi:hypothetical protein